MRPLLGFYGNGTLTTSGVWVLTQRLEPSTNDSPDDDIDPLPILSSESSVNVDGSAESNNTTTTTPTERRYPQCEHQLPLGYQSENLIRH